MDDSSKTELIIAAEAGDLNKVLEILENPPAGFDINQVSDEDGGEMTALDYACEFGHVEIVKALAQKGADVHMSSEYPPIIFAFSAGVFEGPSNTWSPHWAVIKYLIEECKVRPDGSNQHSSAYTDVFEAMGEETFAKNKELVNYITEKMESWTSTHPEEEE